MQKHHAEIIYKKLLLLISTVFVKYRKKFIYVSFKISVKQFYV